MFALILQLIKMIIFVAVVVIFLQLEVGEDRLSHRAERFLEGSPIVITLQNWVDDWIESSRKVLED